MFSNRHFVKVWAFIIPSLLLTLFNSYEVKGKTIDREVTLDDTGQMIQCSQLPKRIVSLAPNMTEILFAIGVGNRVVGVTDFCDYPSIGKEKVRVGGAQIQTEAVLALHPDLVVANADIQPGIIKQFRSLGVKVVAYRPRNWSSVIHTIEQVGQITGERVAASRLIRGMESRRIHITQLVGGRKRIRVFIEVWNKPLMTAGPGTFLHELIIMAGADDIASDLKRPWAVISAEEVIQKDPEIIILTCKNKSELLRRPGWKKVTAVQRGFVYEVDPDIFSRPGPRLIDALEILSKLLDKSTVENCKTKGERS